MDCPKCGTNMVADLEITGGCHGQHGEEGYCYCDSKDVNVSFDCPNRCKEGRDIKPEGLRDQYGIARYLTEHFTV